ncbi:flagellar hook-associated protein 3 [Pimelobacter simplex]|uniref:Flagellar hook-associated protein FlgL n=1 Tax=Nocardioides simplex TaxID=2045 RepID=A0A0A1DG80_NOCSI|nr:flagellar hook-associated protein FlgL [Pimelobacter simplex]AIY16341.1 Flagellar hook-associated protein FlgL [Pimelobacter simplex]MCG8153015.1 flagellar hook-associated protein 3 [Pimelobacter simplex]GEB11982.1 flagellar hook-associated protein FlgL [Pimelobacter simplex]SFN04008.1 flagellar hook-associated protein 3 FlgL [Pimelobacter simplex]
MSIGRVTQRMLTEGSLGHLQQGLGRLARLQEQLSTGKVINRPSDNPTGTTAAMRMRGSMADQTQYSRNAQDGLGWLTQIDSALDSVTTTVRRARDLALQGANASASGQVARDAIATEVEGLRKELLSRANTTYLDSPVFGGVTAGRTAYDASGNYVGTVGDVNRRIAEGVVVKVDLDGPVVFGDGATSVFAELDALATALRAGDQAGISNAITTLNTRMETVTAARTAAGTRYQRLEQADQAAGDAKISLEKQLSTVENADLAETTVALKLQEVAYQAALGATSRVLQPSLLDFLR